MRQDRKGGRQGTLRGRTWTTVCADPLFWGILAGLSILTLASAQVSNRTSDSAGYTSLHLLDVRLWAVPIFFKLFPSDSWRVLAQSVFSVVAWSTFTWVAAARLVHRLLRSVLALFVVCIALSVAVRQYDVIILSESLILSLLLLACAASIAFFRRPSFHRLLLTLVPVVFLYFGRQALVSVLACSGLGVLVASRWASNRKLTVALGLCIVAVGIPAGILSISVSRPIIRYNELTIIKSRVLPDPLATRYFLDRGLPLSQRMRQEPGQVEAVADEWLHDRKLITWLDTDFVSTYGGWIFRHPWSTAADSMQEMPQLIQAIPSYTARSIPLPTDRLADDVWNSNWVFACLISLATVLGLRFVLIRDRMVIERLFGAGLAVIGFADYMTGWLLDGAELPRVVLPGSVMMRLGLIVLAIASADLIGTRSGLETSPATRLPSPPGTRGQLPQG